MYKLLNLKLFSFSACHVLHTFVMLKFIFHPFHFAALFSSSWMRRFEELSLFLNSWIKSFWHLSFLTLGSPTFLEIRLENYLFAGYNLYVYNTVYRLLLLQTIPIDCKALHPFSASFYQLWDLQRSSLDWSGYCIYYLFLPQVTFQPHFPICIVSHGQMEPC